MIEHVTVFLHWAIGGALGLAALCFVAFFWWPGLRLGRELRRAEKELGSLSGQGPVLKLDQVEKLAMVSSSLKHCWTEFRETLHPQKALNASGAMEVSRWRATAMAGGFFTEATLVDTRLRTEFFRHLPGILTGIGIIGTFSGLILGLQNFKVSSDAGTAQASLQLLLKAVGGAFILSAAAISLAMIVTFIEKVIVSNRYAAVERLCGLLDGLFESGAGEEYLARLVEASETSATQAAHIKDALVSDLKSILTDLTERQMASISASNAQTAQAIGSALTESLKKPLEEISGAVKNVSSQQGDAVNKLLTDVLANFAAKMEGMFGGQLSGMNELLKQTAETMQGTANRFEQLAGKIEQAGSGAADKMAQRMETLMESIASRQADADTTMTAFIEQLRDMVNDGQSESSQLMQRTFVELSETTSALVKQLEEQSARSNLDLTRHTETFAARVSEGQTESAALIKRTFDELSEKTSGLVKQLEDQSAQSNRDLMRHSEIFATKAGESISQQSTQIEALTAAVEAAAQTMQSSIERMRTGVDENISRMGNAAERLHAASGALEASLKAMSDAAGSVDGGIDDLVKAAASLNSTLAVTQQAVAEQKEIRAALALMVNELRQMVETASREASVTSQLVGSLEGAAGKLVDAQREADNYLMGVTETLAAAHKAFADHVGSTLQRGNADFHKELARATELLRGAIQELGDTLDTVPSGRR